ncbi:MAG: aldose epimerase family protein [Paracoccaceae bacterium]
MIRRFGVQADGRAVDAVTLAGGGLTATVLTRGAILNDLRLTGVPWSVVLGAPDLAPYEAGMAYYGAIVGPVANRISRGRAEIAGRTCVFEANAHGILLHGGATGTHAQVWEIAARDAASVTLATDLPDGLGGFPGNRHLRATYALPGDGVLELTIEADTDAPTLLNLAHHGYWNLDGTPDYTGHRLRIMAERYTPVDDLLIPTGETAPVAGTPLDFRAARALAPGRDARVDHNFCTGDARGGLRPVLELTGTSGVALAVETTEPGLQVFDGGNGAAAAFTGHDGRGLGPFAGMAIEPQCWPDAPHNPGFPPILHGPDTPYRQVTRFRLTR